MTPRKVPIVCARAPRHIVYVPAVRGLTEPGTERVSSRESPQDVPGALSPWTCSFCGARVKVVA